MVSCGLVCKIVCLAIAVAWLFEYANGKTIASPSTPSTASSFMFLPVFDNAMNSIGNGPSASAPTPTSGASLATTTASSEQQASNNKQVANSSSSTEKDEEMMSLLQAEAIEQFWLVRREQFFNLTIFKLTKKTSDLVGDEFGNRKYHLPFWFDFEMFKNLTERSYPDQDVELKRHHIYVENCLAIWKDEALKRLHRPNNFTFVDHAGDWTQFENYNEEWGEISLNLTTSERVESPLSKSMRLVQDEITSCTVRRDKPLCVMLLVGLEERFGAPMKLKYPFEDERYRSSLDIDAAEDAAAEFSDSLLSADGKSSYWLERREIFFKNTSFSLNERLKRLVGPTYADKTYHLPFWFDYEVFKRMIGRINESPQEELKSNHKYVDSCLEIWNDTVTERLGQLDYEAGGITSHVDIPARTCLYNCNPFDYDVTEEEARESPVDKALRLVKEELDEVADRKRAILLLVELEEKFDFPRARGMRYPFEPERSHEAFWKYLEDRDKSIEEFVKSLDASNTTTTSKPSR